MDALITFLNETGERFLSFAWPMLWQSSLLIAALLLLDLALRRRVRAVVRYALLLLILVKLVIPPSIASPTSLAWWLVPAKKIEERPAAGTVVTKAITDMPRVAVDESAAFTLEPIKIPPPRLQRPGWFVLGWCGIGLMLACWLLGRLLSMRRRAARGVGGINNTTNVLAECRRRLCVPGRIRVEICEDAASPAVFGLFRPVILLPKRLLNSLSVDQLRAVLLHELAHIRRGDVWVNCAQILLQIVYWWHPLLWLANAYIRRVREEAVDETVQVALGNEADIYPTTLVKVAQSIIVRPGLSLGLVSIAEPKSALGRRVKRMLDRPVPRTARLNVWSIVAIFFCAALLLPMARGQQRMDTDANKPPETQPTSIVSLRFACVELPEEMAKTIWESSSNCTIRPNETWNAWLSEDQLEILKSNSVFAASNTLSVTTLSGREAQVQSVELKTVVSGIKPDALVPPGVTSTNENPSGAALETESMRFGSVLDIIPVVDAGTNFVSMSLTASVTEFLGYAESSSSGETLVYVNGRPQRVAVPAPLIRTRLMSLSTSVEDGITLVLGNPMDENGQPVETPGDGEKRLLVFMTPTLIDSQGNRIHERKSATSTRIIVPAPYPIRNVGESATNIPATPVKQSTESSSVTNNSFAESLPKSMYEKSTNPTVVYGLKFRSGEASATNHNLGHTGAARQRIISKLQSIVLGEVSFDAVPLSQAIRELSEAARKADPEETGVSFIINPRAQRIDEPTGLSVTGDLATLPVTINPPLLQVRLLDVLDAIVKVAEEPIQYSIEDYEVVFRQRTNEITPLYTRVFKVDRATLSQGLVRAGVLAPESTNDRMEVGKAFRDMLAVEGIDLGPPKAIFYNDSEGRLHVRSALQELEIVERLLQMLSAQPAKIHIAVKFIEVPETVIDKVGNRLFRAVPRRGASSAILARNQFTELIRLLRADSGTELLSNSGVTTLSGRQAQVQALDMRTILTGIKSEALTFPSVSSTNGAGVSDVFERKSTPFGTVLDVVPYVEADGVTFSMFINLTVTKFLGYEGSASKADVRVYVNGQEERASMPPHPNHHLRRMSITSRVRDGYTLVVGNPTDADGNTAEQPGDGQKRLLVFVTPTIVDPAGHRVNPPDALPFKSDSIPPQR